MRLGYAYGPILLGARYGLSVGKLVILWGCGGIVEDQYYPLANIQKAIENGHL